VQHGCGVLCGMHLDDLEGGDTTNCKKEIHFGKRPLSQRACIVALKRWIIAGLTIAEDDPRARSRHRDIDARSLADASISDAALESEFVAASRARKCSAVCRHSVIPLPAWSIPTPSRSSPLSPFPCPLPLFAPCPCSPRPPRSPRPPSPPHLLSVNAA
jgi:hypothetical protein